MGPLSLIQTYGRDSPCGHSFTFIFTFWFKFHLVPLPDKNRIGPKHQFMTKHLKNQVPAQDFTFDVTKKTNHAKLILEILWLLNRFYNRISNAGNIACWDA